MKNKQTGPIGELSHKLNKSRFARDIGTSLATVKRAAERLLENNFILESTDRKGYSIPNIISFLSNEEGDAALIGTETPRDVTGSFLETGGSILEITGSKSEESGSFLDNNTQYETNQKLIGNQSEKKEETEPERNIEEKTYSSSKTESRIISRKSDETGSGLSSKTIKSSKFAHETNQGD